MVQEKNMKARVTKRLNKPSKTDKIFFIVHNVFYIFALCFFLFFGFFTTTEYPAKESLVYEECTFIKSEYISKENRNHSTTRYYNIYVEEYDKPLEIDNIIYDRIHQGFLSNLEKGDKITVSIRHYKDDMNLYDMNLYEMYYGEKYVLTYDDYSEGHKENDEIGFILAHVFIFLISGLIVAEFIHYKTKGKPLPWPRSVYT